MKGLASFPLVKGSGLLTSSVPASRPAATTAPPFEIAQPADQNERLRRRPAQGQRRCQS